MNPNCSPIGGVSPSCTHHLRIRLAYFRTGKRSFTARGLSSSLSLRLSCTRRSLGHQKAVAGHGPVSTKNYEPHSKFTEEDLKRIKEFGPSIKDLTEQHEIALDDGAAIATLTEVEYIPHHVLATREYDTEPQWSQIPRMNTIEFFQGIRERNWKSGYFKPDAQPWKLEFFADSGRLFRPIFSGYRVLVTPKDGEVQWVQLAQPGLLTFLEDTSLDRELRAGDCGPRAYTLASPVQIGYNQILEQLHYAFEEQISPESEREFVSKGWIRSTSSSGATEKYDCPGEKLLDFAFYYTPPEPCLHGTWEMLPPVFFVIFAFSFLGVCLFLGIFAPRKQMPTDPMQAMEFAQSKGKARVDGRTSVGFKDVAGLDTIIDDLKEIVKFLQEPKKYVSLGARAPKGVLLDGPPGTGKTLIAKAMAGEAGVPFYQMSGSEFVEAIVGVGAARVRDLFKRARVQDEACVVFVDEIDALGIKRAEAGVQTNEEREQTLNQLLTEMDGFSSEQGVVFVGATNRADLLDPALTRAGRFDKKVRVRKPDTEARHQILQVHARKLKSLAPDVDLLQLARDLPGVSGADLENILNESALNAVRREGSEVNVHDVYDAVDRILQGLRQPIHIRNMAHMGKVISGHEAGRAIVAHVLKKTRGQLEAIKSVSIIPRGSELSRTIFFRMADEEYTLTTKAKLLDRIRVVLSGRAAEDLLFEDPTSYGTKDLESAHRLAVKLVANYGMSDLGITTYAPASSKFSTGRSIEVSVDNIDEDLFGRGIGGGLFQPSGASVHEIRMHANSIVSEAYEDCKGILSNYAASLGACSELLLEKEEMTGDDIEAVIAKNPPLEPEKEVPIPVEREMHHVEEHHVEEHHTRTESQAVSLEPSVSNLMKSQNEEVLLEMQPSLDSA